jgi:FkbM family methyltransferase
MTTNSLLPFQIMNRFYKINFNLYRRIYFLYKSVNEAREIALIKKIVKPGMVVVDIGANIGFYTLLLSRLVETKGRVYSFEPDRDNFRHLKALCGKKKNTILKNWAVGSKDGVVKLYLSDSLNVDHLTYDNDEKREQVSVKCVTIDRFLKARKVDFIKVDTQGYECAVLQGMSETLKKSHKLFLLSEFSAFDIKKAGGMPQTYLKTLKKLGFGLKFLEADYNKRLYGKNQGRMSYVNILASKGG